MVMEKSFIHQTAVIQNTRHGILQCYKDVRIADSILGEEISIGDDTVVERCQFENNVVINRRSYVNDSQIGRYTYTGINTTINWTHIGRFCSLARNVDIGGFDHNYRRITTMPEFRLKQLKRGGGKLQSLFEAKGYCTIGNDVWIAAGAQILQKVRVGDGAVVGAGAVVTHDVPPYAIVAGVPAKIIGYRCKDEWIQELLTIKWWDWPEEIILENMEAFMESDISDHMIQRMKEISKGILKA